MSAADAGGAVWVWDASALVHAVRAGRLEMLHDLARHRASTHLITDAVHDDLVRQAVVNQVTAFAWPTVAEEPEDDSYGRELVSFQEVLGTSGTRHLGESTVMALARRLQATAVLDDKDARRVAQLRGVRQIGVLGVLDDGVRLGHHNMASAAAFARDLAGSGGRYPRAAVDDFARWSRQRRRALGLS